MTFFVVATNVVNVQYLIEFQIKDIAIFPFLLQHNFDSVQFVTLNINLRHFDAHVLSIHYGFANQGE